MKLKDGSTPLARCFVLKHKAENAVDLDTGVILAAEITPGRIAYVPSMSLRSLVIASSWASSAKALVTTAVSKTPTNKNPEKGFRRWFLICHFPISWSWTERWAHAISVAVAATEAIPRSRRQSAIDLTDRYSSDDEPYWARVAALMAFIFSLRPSSPL